MPERELKRDLAILPISVVRELTGLSDRQIRYYDQQGLVTPERGAGKQRRFSLNDIDRLLEIADDLDSGLSVADIRELDAKHARQEKENQEADLRKIFADELIRIGRFDDNRRY
ncbi:MerR family glutamine synthetase transcriptional repressor [Weissella uvarum]|uniref:MerR family transcriptional regulator n=1 Tax=Weissella uvarum TaxID=1479233 RepID=UPI00195FDC66|nr:MerR family transcriptional regulator [Weissella uvarum]MBM7616630.1 MerR family glutamine synthetase transcriptional repressor [Weissella uvarum]MCM0594912.1 MerR family transcriptional regulator [Weissella uvarum]